MFNLFEDEDDFLTGSPRSKFFDIVYNANRDLVETELDKLIERVAVLEQIAEENGLEDIDSEVRNRLAIDNGELETRIKSLYIEVVGNVLTQNE